MDQDDRASVTAGLLGPDDGPRWIVGEYDRNPLHIDLSSELVAHLAEGPSIGEAHLLRLAEIVTRKIERGQGRFGRRHPDGQGMLVVALHEDDWAEQS